jgi:hypothetical protein
VEKTFVYYFYRHFSLNGFVCGKEVISDPLYRKERITKLEIL